MSVGHRFIDNSEAMLCFCRHKLANSNVPPNRAKVQLGDMTDFDLERTFNMVIAPYRALQNLETDEQLDGLFTCVRRNLSPDGTCILSAFNPKQSPEVMKAEWCRTEEILEWEVCKSNRRFTCHDRQPRLDSAKVVFSNEAFTGRRMRADGYRLGKCWWPRLARGFCPHGASDHRSAM